jgi:Putative prokaryotic signal transducing protein
MEFGVRLTVVPTEGEAEVICGLLRANGIHCGHREVELASQAFGGWWHEVLVPGDRLEEARELLELGDTTPPTADEI